MNEISQKRWGFQTIELAGIRMAGAIQNFSYNFSQTFPVYRLTGKRLNADLQSSLLRNPVAVTRAE